MSKKTLKRIAIFSIFVSIITTSLITFASGLDPEGIVGSYTPSEEGVGTLFQVGNNILSILQVIALGVTVVATLVLAIKYMYSAPEDKATIKKQLIPYIIGGVLVFGATSLVKLAESLAGDMLA